MQSLHAVRQLNNSQVFTTQQSCFKLKTQTYRAKLGNATNGNTKRTQQGKSLSQHTPFATTELRQTISTATDSCNDHTAHFNRGKARACCPKQGKTVRNFTTQQKNVPKIRTLLL